MPKLYPHQDEAIKSLRASFRSGQLVALLHLPTGSGKTLIASEFIRLMLTASPKASFLFIVPKVKLAEQSEAAIAKHTGATVSVYCGSLSRYELGQVTVGTIQSLSLIEKPPTFDVIVIDECHRLQVDKGSDNLKLITKLSHPKTRVLGLTATPYRTGQALWQVSDFWPKPCYSVGIAELTQKGFLAPARLVSGKHAHSTKGFKVVAGEWSRDDLARIAADTDKILKQIKDALSHMKTHERRSAIWLCIDQSHARQVNQALIDLGETSSVVVSSQGLSERSDEFDAYISARSKHLVSVEIAKEGFDDVKTDCVVFLKATRSIVSYLQAVGRALRVDPENPGKVALVLDYGGVVAACGKLDSPLIDWTNSESRDSNAARARVAEEMPYVIVSCKGCGAFFFPERGEPKDCPECGNNSDDDKTRKLREQAATGELYQNKDAINTPFSRFTVTTVNCAVTERGGALTLGVKSAFFGSSVAGQVTLELFAPLNARGLSQGDVNRIAHTKHWLAKGFGLDRNTPAREMLRIVSSHEYLMLPDIIVQTNTRIGYGIESVRQVDKSEAIQETLL